MSAPASRVDSPRWGLGLGRVCSCEILWGGEVPTLVPAGLRNPMRQEQSVLLRTSGWGPGGPWSHDQKQERFGLDGSQEEGERLEPASMTIHAHVTRAFVRSQWYGFRERLGGWTRPQQRWVAPHFTRTKALVLRAVLDFTYGPFPLPAHLYPGTCPSLQNKPVITWFS